MKQSTTGIFQKENGNWYYRFTIMKDGKKHEFKRNTDENGCKLTSQKAAIKAKEVAMRKAQEDLDRIKKPIERKTFSEVYNEYVEKGRNGKAYQTIRKQDSLWNNHLKEKIGERFVDEVSVGEIKDYLTDAIFIAFDVLEVTGYSGYTNAQALCVFWFIPRLLGTGGGAKSRWRKRSVLFEKIAKIIFVFKTAGK